MPADKSTLATAVAVLAKTRGRAWLAGELERVTLAFVAGAPVIKSLSIEGAAGTGDFEVRTDDLLEVLKKALDELDGAASQGAMLIPRFTDFPLS